MLMNISQCSVQKGTQIYAKQVKFKVKSTGLSVYMFKCEFNMWVLQQEDT